METSELKALLDRLEAAAENQTYDGRAFVLVKAVDIFQVVNEVRALLEQS